MCLNCPPSNSVWPCLAAWLYFDMLQFFRNVFNPYDVGISDTNLKYRWLVFIVRILVIGFIILTIKRYLNIWKHILDHRDTNKYYLHSYQVYKILAYNLWATVNKKPHERGAWYHFSFSSITRILSCIDLIFFSCLMASTTSNTSVSSFLFLNPKWWPLQLGCLFMKSSCSVIAFFLVDAQLKKIKTINRYFFITSAGPSSWSG